MRNRPATRPAFASWPDPAPVNPITDLESLREWHENRCAYCGYDAHILDTDHDHDTGIVRGFLCRGCNLLIGKYPTPVDHPPYWAWMSGDTPAERFGIMAVYLKPQNGLPVFKVGTVETAAHIFTVAGLDFSALPAVRHVEPDAEALTEALSHVRALCQKSYARHREQLEELTALQSDHDSLNAALSRG